MSEETVNIAEIFEMMPARFDKEAAEGIEAIYQFELTGQGGGTYQVRIEGGGCNVVEGPADNPTITITMQASDYVDLIHGRLNAQMAFMGGKLKIKGDMSLALKMQQVFPNL